MAHEKLRESADELMQTIKEEIDACVMLGDVARLTRLANAFRRQLDSELVSCLRRKGFGEELRKLCDKAGRSTK